MKKNIVVVGFMGAGKSLISKKLAQKLNFPVFSTDKLIEEKEGRSISNIFQSSTETYFRKVEKEIVLKVSEQENVIIDCGGGVVLDADNIANLKRNGSIFYLFTPPETIYERVKHKTTRPLLNSENPGEKIKELLKQRQPFYAQADHTIDTRDKTVDEIVNEIIIKYKQ